MANDQFLLNDIHFQWGRSKARSNVRKHGVSFEKACEAFFDPLLLPLETEVTGGEERERFIGLTTSWRLLYVGYTIRDVSIRIISVRPATAAERKTYENG